MAKDSKKVTIVNQYRNDNICETLDRLLKDALTGKIRGLVFAAEYVPEEVGKREVTIGLDHNDPVQILRETEHLLDMVRDVIDDQVEVKKLIK